MTSNKYQKFLDVGEKKKNDEILKIFSSNPNPIVSSLPKDVCFQIYNASVSLSQSCKGKDGAGFEDTCSVPENLKDIIGIQRQVNIKNGKMSKSKKIKKVGTARSFFASEVRDRLKEEGKTKKFITATIKREWKDLKGKPEMTKYTDLNKADKTRYESEIAESGGVSGKKSVGRTNDGREDVVPYLKSQGPYKCGDRIPVVISYKISTRERWKQDQDLAKKCTVFLVTLGGTNPEKLYKDITVSKLKKINNAVGCNLKIVVPSDDLPKFKTEKFTKDYMPLCLSENDMWKQTVAILLPNAK